MDDFFRLIKNNEPVRKNFEVEVNPDDEDDQYEEERTKGERIKEERPKEPTPLMKDSQPDNFKFGGSITKVMPVTENEEKFDYFADTSLEEAKPKEKEAANELEKMLEETGENTDFLS